MVKGQKKSFFTVCIFALSSFLCLAFPGTGTIRERAKIHFDLVKWASSNDLSPAVAPDAAVVSGGNETFSALGADRDTGVPSLYPSLPEIGSLDYSDIDQGLIDILIKLAAGLKDKKIEPGWCYPARPFIPVIALYQLDKLPPANQVFFSRPEKDAEGVYGSVFRMRVTDGSAKDMVLVNVKASFYQGNWYIDEIYFDGKSYAAIARQD